MLCPYFLGTTYPLDLVRSRLSIATASIPVQHSTSTISTQRPSLASGYHTTSVSSRSIHPTKHFAWTPKDLTMWGMTLKVMREEGGFRALYRGMIPTAVGVAPYVGINFAAYETLRGIITPPDKTTVIRKLSCGALAGKLLSENLCSVSCNLIPFFCFATEQGRFRRRSHIHSTCYDGRCKFEGWARHLDHNTTVHCMLWL